MVGALDLAVAATVIRVRRLTRRWIRKSAHLAVAEVAKYGTGFTRAVRAAFNLIARFSEAWAAYPKRQSLRRYVVKRYPFVIVYR